MRYNISKVYSQHFTIKSELTDEEIFKELACKLVHNMPFEDFSKIFNCSKDIRYGMNYSLDLDRDKDIHFNVNLEFNIL